MSRNSLYVAVDIGAPPEKVFEAPVVSLLYGAMIEKYVTTESQKLKRRRESAAA